MVRQEPPGEADAIELLQRVAGVGLVMMAFMIGAKLVIMGWPGYPIFYYSLDLATSECGDLLFTAAFCALGYLILYLFRRREMLRKTTWVAFLILAVLNVIFSAINVEIFKAMAMPLTYSLLQMAGDMEHMRSSIELVSTPKTLIILASLPVVFLAMVWMVDRFRPLRFSWLSGPLVGTLVVYLAAAPLGRYVRIDSAWGLAVERRAMLTMNPQWLLLKTCAIGLMTSSPAGLAESPSHEYFEDFRTVTQIARAPLASHQPRVKNVIVVVLESVGDQFLTMNGGKYPVTPNLQAEAKHSLIFPNFYSNAGATPLSIIPLVLSIYPGVGWQLYTPSTPHMQGESTADILHRRGYHTAFMSSQDLTFRRMNEFLQNRGFDLIEDYRDYGSRSLLTSWGGDDPSLFDEMMRWIDEQHDKPFYLCAWTQQTHHPYSLTSSQRFVDYLHDDSNQTVINLNNYLNTLRVTDEQLGRLFEHLRKTGHADDTLVVITGDHGEAFARPHSWTAHGTSLYQESINIPLILWNPKLFSPGSRNQTVGSHVDLNPTILDFLGIEPSPLWQGSSLFASSHANRAYSATTAGFVLLGMREDNWKFIYNATVGHFELYDLLSDPTEQKNIASLRKDLCDTFYQRVSAWAQYERRHMDEVTHGAHSETAATDQ
jgi:lipoteichoic acid synthase